MARLEKFLNQRGIFRDVSIEVWTVTLQPKTLNIHAKINVNY